jgi:hypothetical protein
MKISAISRVAAKSVSVAGILGTCALLTACGGNANSTSPSAIRGNLTPELSSLTARSVDLSNERAITFNTNFRAMVDDFNRAALLDRPSRLTVYPMPH